MYVSDEDKKRRETQEEGKVGEDLHNEMPSMFEGLCDEVFVKSVPPD